MSEELRLKKLRGSGGSIMARVTDQQQTKGNLGGPDLFLAPIGRLDSDKISRYMCNTCEREFEGSPKIDFENPNEEVADNLILVERGQYICNECGSTIAEYRDFKKPDEMSQVGLANPIDQNEQASFADFENFAETPTVQDEIVSETSPIDSSFRSIMGMDIYDESAKKIGIAKQVGVDSTQKIVLVISDSEGNDVTINWNRIGTVGEVIFLGKNSTAGVPQTTEIQAGEGLRCSSCNFDNKTDSKFCESCGTKL